MKSVVVYDSLYGNTKAIAQAIGDALPGEVQVLSVGEVNPGDLGTADLLIVGSPTQRLRPTVAATSFLKSIPQKGLKGVKVAAFDTRLTWSEIEKVRILAFVVKIFGGYAAAPIAGRLGKKGGELTVSPVGFYVASGEGPLVEGELERAAAWARQIVATL
jgi:flavodoxin I